MNPPWKSAILRGVLSLAWIGCAGYLAFRDWDPLKLHYLSLFFREAPIFFQDIPAAFQKLFPEGARELGYVILLVFAAAGSGRVAIGLLRISLPLLSRSIISLALGFIIVGYSTFLLGIADLYTATGRHISICALVIGAFFALPRRSSLQGLQGKIKALWPLCGMFGVLGVLAIFLFAKALWPAVYIDAITYHLGNPNYYLQEGSFSHNPYDICSNYPFLAEMLYTLAMLVAGQKAAQFTSVVFFLVSILAVFEFTKTLIGASYARLATLVYAFTPCFMEAAMLCGNDVLLVLYVLLAVYSYFLWHFHIRSNGLLLLTGFFAGACLSIKYTAFIYIPLLLAAGLAYDAWIYEKRLGRVVLKRLAVCAAAAGVVCLPWMASNILHTGNPVYPALFYFFGGSDMSPEMYATAAQWGGSISSATFFSAAGKTLRGVFLFGPELFSEMGTMGNTGLALLFFLPLLPLANRISPVVKVLCFSCALLFSALIMRFACIRFFYPGIMFLLIIAAYVLRCLLQQLPRPFKPFLFCAAVICMVANAGMGMYQVNMRTMTYGADFLHDSDDRYLRRHMIGNKEALLDSYPVNCYINENTRPDARILIIGDVQHLYINRRHLYTYLSATTPYDALKNCSRDCRDTRQALKEKGITHILFSPFELKRLQEIGAIAWKKEDNPHMENFFKSPCVRQIYASKRPAIEVMLFELM